MLIIGGSGDLSRRHLLPALTRLLANNELSEGFALTVTGLEPMSVEECRDLIGGELAAHAGQLPGNARASLLERISYLQADVRAADSLREIAAGEPLLIYVATPPVVVPAALEAVARAELHRSARIILDKPFGLSHSSAKILNTQVLELVDEDEVYRVDHFLYHHTVQELVRWRVQSDPLSLAEVLPIAEVEIAWDETRAAQSTGLPYPGAMRDMIQSHLLQLAAVLTMDSPNSMTRANLAACRLGALRRISAASDRGSWAMRGRLTGDGESGTASAGPSEPETFATITLCSEMPRWKDVRFLLRAAKGLDESRRHIELRLARRADRKPPPFLRLEVLDGQLVIGVVGGAALEFSVSSDAESASTRLLRAALVGDDRHTLSPEEPEEAWRIVEPVLEAWDNGQTPMLSYRVGASAASIVRDGLERCDA